MATLIINIPNNKLSLVLDAYANTYNYQEEILDISGNTIPNTVTKADFAKEVIIQQIKDVVKSYKIRNDSNQIILNANQESDNLGLG